MQRRFFVWQGVARNGRETFTLMGDGEVEQERPDLHRGVYGQAGPRGVLCDPVEDLPAPDRIMRLFRTRLGAGHGIDHPPTAGEKPQQLAIDAVDPGAEPGAFVLRYGAAHSRPGLPAR
jgi:hypothetical protein